MESLRHRLKQLQAEFEAGQRELAELERKEAALRQTQKRISGAISVLKEELKVAESQSAK